MFPCKGCTDREVGCHSTCKKYLDTKKVWDKKTIEKRKREREEDEIDDYHIRRSTSSRKRYRIKGR